MAHHCGDMQASLYTDRALVVIREKDQRSLLRDAQAVLAATIGAFEHWDNADPRACGSS